MLEQFNKVTSICRFQDKLKISITDGQVHTILLAAQGTGTTIVSEPPMTPLVNIGAIFSSRPCTRKFRLVNRGRRTQQLFWSTEGFALIRSKKKQEYNLEDVKYQVEFYFDEVIQISHAQISIVYFGGFYFYLSVVHHYVSVDCL